MFAKTSATVDIIKQLLAIGLAVFWQFLVELEDLDGGLLVHGCHCFCSRIMSH